MIKIDNITKTYTSGNKKTTVLKNISLNIEKGEFISIIGQSGGGKSTLMNIIGGLTSPTSGEIYYNNKKISDLNSKELAKYRQEAIGFVFQDFNLEGNETVLENIMMPMVFAGINILDRKKKAIEVLKKVNLDDKINNKANQLSGGQKQRVAIARALINNPKIILADEPTGNLDVKNSEDIVNLFKQLNKEGYTIIMVTHNIKQSYEADRVIKIKNGEINKIASTDLMSEFVNVKEESKKEYMETDKKLNIILELLKDNEISALFSNYILQDSNIKVGVIKKRLKSEIKNIEKEI